MKYDVKHYSYIGDCVWELFIREHIIKKTQNLKNMHSLTTKYVRAEYQADMINKIMNVLSDDELDIQHRSRNIKMTINKKSNPALHSLATSFEALIGYLYLENRERLDEILKLIENEMAELK